MADVVGTAETFSATLQEIQSGVDVRETVARVENELAQVTQEIDAQRSESARVLVPGVVLEAVEDLERRWRRLNDELARWSTELTTRASALDQGLARVPHWQATWNETLRLAQDSGAPPEVTTHIQDVLAAIEATANILRQKRAPLLALQSRVAAQQQRVAAELRLVKTTKEKAVEQLWVQEAAPLWNPDVRLAATRDLVEQGQASLQTQATRLRTFLTREGERLFYLAVIFCALAFLLFKIKQRAARWTDLDPDLERANRVLRFPVAMAAVLTFLCSRFLFDNAPQIFWAAFAALALIPIIVLLRQLIDRYLFPILNALVVFYLVAQVRSIAAMLPVLSRFMLLLEMVGGAIFLVWFIRSTRAAPPGTISRKATRAGARLALVLFAAVFLANLFGFVALANYLARGALAAAYLAIAFYAIAGIVVGLSFFALQIWPLASLRVVKNHRPLLRARTARFLYFLAFVFWVVQTLEVLSLRGPIFERVRAIVTAESSIGSLHISLGAVLAFGLTVWLAVLLSRFIRFLLEEDIYARMHLTRGSTYAVSTILHYTILLLGFFAAVAAIGVDMTKFTILAGAFGVGIGFGLQNIINNFVSGLILLFERPVQVGDVVQVGDATGTILRIGIRASVLRLPNASELIIPNGMLISEKVGNWTLSNRQRRMDLRVGVAYGTDPERVIALLEKVAAGHPLVTDTPAPMALFKEFGDNALQFDLLFWTNDFDQWMRVQSDIAVAVNAALAEAKITIPFPQRDLHLQSIAPGAAVAFQNRGQTPPSP